MDDNLDTYKTANYEINQLFFERLINYLILLILSYLCKYVSLTALNIIRSPTITFTLVKSFITGSALALALLYEPYG
jgi:hypothetical protein